MTSNTANSYFQTRVAALQKKVATNQAILLSQPHDIKYFSGFEILVPEEREAFLIVTPDQVILQHASFSPADVPITCLKASGCYPNDLKKTIIALVKNEKVSELLIDESTLFVNEYKALPDTLRLTPLDTNLIWEIRMIKDQLEVSKLEKAGQIAASAFQQVVGIAGSQLRAGQTELEIAKLLEQAMRELGADSPAFPTIVAFGPAGALPHYQPSDQVLADNMAVLIDFGATYQGYRSDMTRSFWFGNQPDPQFVEIETIVMAAYEEAVSTLGAKAEGSPTAKDIDSAARDHIRENGFGPEFIHTTGHGLGLDIHEQPSLNWQNPTTLQPGMAITIEPGIYLADKFGYRHENTFLVTESTPRNLTNQ